MLKARGLGIEQSFDSSLFINRAISLLSGNLFAGVLLAVGCLWWFLRDCRATLLIASAIPISLLATFIVLELTGRSLNVISLAGPGVRRRHGDGRGGRRRREHRAPARGRQDAAARRRCDGTRQVAGALFASTLTTIAVFLPVIFMEDVEGQLFADLALTISIAVAISLLVARDRAAGGGRRLAARRRLGRHRTARLSARSPAGSCARPRRGRGSSAWVAALVARAGAAGAAADAAASTTCRRSSAPRSTRSSTSRRA